tara:strand:- start:30 stop:248 length:219 start_codon:yes stop_codon:yes gene_type:complete
MSTEKFIDIKEENTIILKTAEEVNKKKTSGRVDINNLMARARIEQRKENKTNLVFLGLFSTLILIIGTILSF